MSRPPGERAHLGREPPDQGGPTAKGGILIIRAGGVGNKRGPGRTQGAPGRSAAAEIEPRDTSVTDHLFCSQELLADRTAGTSFDASRLWHRDRPDKQPAMHGRGRPLSAPRDRRGGRIRWRTRATWLRHARQVPRGPALRRSLNEQRGSAPPSRWTRHDHGAQHRVQRAMPSEIVIEVLRGDTAEGDEPPGEAASIGVRRFDALNGRRPTAPLVVKHAATRSNESCDGSAPSFERVHDGRSTLEARVENPRHVRRTQRRHAREAGGDAVGSVHTDEDTRGGHTSDHAPLLSTASRARHAALPLQRLGLPQHEDFDPPCDALAALDELAADPVTPAEGSGRMDADAQGRRADGESVDHAHQEGR